MAARHICALGLTDVHCAVALRRTDLLAVRAAVLNSGLGPSVAAASGLDLGLGLRLPAVASAALLRSCVAVATAVSARFRSRGRGNREGGYTGGQKEPGHDKNSKCFACTNEGRRGSVPAAKCASSALTSTLAQ
jgi:hypothetical protein